MRVIGSPKGHTMLKRVISLIIGLAAGPALAEGPQPPTTSFPPGQSVTGPASERPAAGNVPAGNGKSEKPRSSSTSKPETSDGRNGGESGFSKEERPGVNSSTSNSY